MDSILEQELSASRTDFEKVFEELYSLYIQYNLPGINNTFSVRFIDELVLTSGKLITCDPLCPLGLWELEARRLSIILPPGRYPVILGVLNLDPFSDSNQIYTCAMLLLSNQPAVKWKLGHCVNKDAFCYGVDSGTGCFMDIDAAQLWCQSWLLEDEREEIIERFGIELAEPILPEVGLAAAIEENQKRGVGDWASIRFKDMTEANIVAFCTGGDGIYTSWLGYDMQGNIVNVITDFLVYPHAYY